MIKRSTAVLSLLLVALGSVALFAGGYWVAHRVCKHQARPTDDLDWLRQDFKLTEAQCQRIRQLHEGYLPQCRHWCEQIADRQQQLAAELRRASAPTPKASELLAEIASLRSHCQSDMLRHFFEVSQAMPPEQGRRYLKEMQRLTLGAHEQIEQSMSGSTHVHGHH